MVIRKKEKLDCSTLEIIEVGFSGAGLGEFYKYRNFEIVSDSEFVYLLGGQVYNEEKNTFNATVKCFKVEIATGEISAIRDMLVAKMKFGVNLFSGKISIFGGLQTLEKHRSNSCERYDIATNSWASLPCMKKNRVCPLVSTFVPTEDSLLEEMSPLILAIGGMEDKNNINYSIEVFDLDLNIWIEFIEKPVNSKCYIPKQLGYAVQINPEQILIFGGMSGRKQKPTTSLQAYNVSKKSITNISLDSLPIGIIQDFHTGQPVVHNKSIYIVNSQISQYFPVLKQMEAVFNVFKIGLNQQEIIYTHVI